VRPRAALVSLGLAALCGAGCSSTGPPAEALFAEAESLRLRYEKEASREAIARFETAREKWKAAGDSRNAARAARRIGLTHEQLGALAASLESYRRALPLARASGDRSLESEIRSDVGVTQAWVADREEQFEEARTHCQAALDLARQTGDGRAEARALNCLGEAAYYRLRPDEARSYYDEAGRIWERLGDARGRAQTLLYQGYASSDMSRLDEAWALYERARALWTSLRDRRQEAITLVAEARVLRRRGEYQEALNVFESALALLRPMGDAVWEGSSLSGVGATYLELGDTRSALRSWERALELFEAADLEAGAMDALLVLGETYLGAGDDARALSRLERALALAEEQGITRWKAVALRLIGVVHLVRGQPLQARAHLERSLALQRSPGVTREARDEARTLADLAEACLALGEHAAAARHFGSSLDLGRGAGDRAVEARALLGLARASRAVRDLEAARRHVEHSLQVVESLRTDVDDRSLRVSYLASVHRHHEVHVDVLMGLHALEPGRGLDAAAFAASERARARSLIESLAESGVDLQQGVDPALVRRERQARRAFDDWAERQRRAAPSSAAALADEYRELEERYQRVQAEIRSRSPRYAALASPRPLGLEEVQARVLDGDTLLLEYALGDERSFLWAVSKTDRASFELPPRAEIEGLARRVYDRLTARLGARGDARESWRRVEDEDSAYWSDAARLSDMLLGKAAPRLRGKRILVVPDGSLQSLPFAALPEPGRSGTPVPMVVEHEIVSLPSASVLDVMRAEAKERRLPQRTLAVLADPVFELDDPRLKGAGGASRPRPAAGRGYPRLAATRQEADAILRLAPAGTTLRALGFDASRATAMSPELARYGIVHFATHGVFDDENPGLSGLVLSTYGENGEPQDGVLRLRDVYGLRLPAELVVLSACSTALGQPVKGEGLVGVVRGFMYAGARRVVASLWKVEDEATGEMMERFYRAMLEEKRSPAAALREAQVGMWRQDRWRSPYYWAAFVLQGEYR
jgi:CHAT domain-containing protein